jgi:uncharacterized protein with GYD domain
MPSYVALLDWTDQGIRSFKDSVHRYEASQRQFEELGIRFTDVRWCLGGHDIVAIIDAPDDETLATALLSLGSLGNVRSTTMRAFSHDEMLSIVSKAP